MTGRLCAETEKWNMVYSTQNSVRIRPVCRGGEEPGAVLPEGLGDGSHGGRPPERFLLPDGARDAAGQATARAHAIMAAHLRCGITAERDGIGRHEAAVGEHRAKSCLASDVPHRM
jgi:hypothetical protein